MSKKPEDQLEDTQMVEEVNPNLVTSSETEELDEVKQISHLATGIHNWHVEVVNQMTHVLNMPIQQEGDEVYVGVFVLAEEGHPDRNPDTGMRQLRKEELPTFLAGVRYAYDLVVGLPFKFLPTDADGNIHPEYNDSEVGDEEQANP